MKIPSFLCCASTLLALAISSAGAPPKVSHKAWTDPEAALREDPDFAIQGEYINYSEKVTVGLQIVALGEGKFDAYMLEGRLPAAGWKPGMSRVLLKGNRDDNKITFADATGKITVRMMENRRFVLTDNNNPGVELKRIERKSSTLGAKAPAGAVVLFDGTSTDSWENGKMENGLLLATGCTSKQQSADYTLHLEFRTPYMPTARGQQRGNSGVYHSGRWETQILDSFGLEGKENDCGGIYSISKPRLNMCLPPLAWQTYDVVFTAAKFDADGKRTAWPRITVKLNDVVVHEDLELPKDFTTSAPNNRPLDGPKGPVFLQHHNNPVVFRNIWIIPGK